MSTNELVMLDSKINLIKTYEAEAKNLQDKADELKDGIKKQMTDLRTDEITTPNYVVRWVDVLTTRFDTKRFKEDMGEDSYNYYTKQVSSKRFTISD